MSLEKCPRITHKVLSQTENEQNLFIEPKTTGPLLQRQPLNLIGRFMVILGIFKIASSK